MQKRLQAPVIILMVGGGFTIFCSLVGCYGAISAKRSILNLVQIYFTVVCILFKYILHVGLFSTHQQCFWRPVCKWQGQSSPSFEVEIIQIGTNACKRKCANFSCSTPCTLAMYRSKVQLPKATGTLHKNRFPLYDFLFQS